MRRSNRTECSRGHPLEGYNAKPYTGRRHATPQCRACHGANQWAKKQNLFNDDPRTIARANELFAKYQEMQ